MDVRPGSVRRIRTKGRIVPPSKDEGGNPARCEEIVRRMGMPASAAAKRILTEPADVADVAQDTVINVLEALDAGTSITYLNAYTSRVAHNLALDKWRDRTRHVSLVDDSPERGEASMDDFEDIIDRKDPLALLERKERLQQLRRLLAIVAETMRSLPEQDQVLLNLVTVADGPGWDEIAEHFGKTKEAVRRQFYRLLVRVDVTVRKRAQADPPIADVFERILATPEEFHSSLLRLVRLLGAVRRDGSRS